MFMYWDKSHSTVKGCLAFTIFSILSIICGVLVVVITSYEFKQTCQLRFQRINKSSISLSSQPRSIATADFNNDQYLDIVVANSGMNAIGIYLAHANDTYKFEHIYSTELYSNPHSVVVTDFNNDSYIDIAVANYGTNNIGIFLGYNNGTFHKQIQISTGSSKPVFILTADFNYDQRSDIAIANNGTDNIGILLGYGNGLFQKMIIYSTGYDSRPCSLTLGDFNNDYYLDLAVANYGTDNIGIFLGYGNGTFQNQIIYSTFLNSNPTSIIATDIDNDKQLDILVTNSGTNNIGIFHGFKNGTFDIQKTYSIDKSFQLEYITIADFNTDDQNDIVVIDSENDRIYFLSEYDQGSFSKLTAYDSIPDSKPLFAAVNDLNNDNQSDLVIANFDTNDILVLMEYHQKPSARQKIYPAIPKSPLSSVVVYRQKNQNDFNIISNGIIDGILILTSLENENFLLNGNYSTGKESAPQYIGMADLNHDDYIDLVTANAGSDSIGVFIGRDNETFADVIIYSTGIDSTPWWVTFGDMNNDRYLDIITANAYRNEIGIFLGYGNGSFDYVKTYPIKNNAIPRSVAVGDIDNDNQTDIITADSGTNTVSILQKNFNGSYILIRSYPTGKNSNPSSIVLMDINNDQQLDIIVANTYSDAIGVFLGNGNGLFPLRTFYSVGIGSQPYLISIADFNNDGLYDIATTLFGNNAVGILTQNNKSNSFNLSRIYPTGTRSRPFGIATADINNDTQLEIIVTLWGTHSISILTEYSGVMFNIETIYSTGSASNPSSVAIADVNKDNRPDIVVVDSGTDSIEILLGLGNGRFQTSQTYSTGVDTRPNFIITCNINQDNNTDLIIAASESNTIMVMIGSGDGNFTNQNTYSLDDDAHPSGIGLGDFNKDNRIDVAVVDQGLDNIGILLGFAYTAFKKPISYPNVGKSPCYGILVHDFNHDNNLDIAVPLPKIDSIGIRFGYNNGSLSDMITYPTGDGSFPIVLTIGDVNNDNYSDIIVANAQTDNIGIFLGYSNGSFNTMFAISSNGSTPLAVTVADLDNDYNLDIVVVNSQSNNIGILLGYGNGSFANIRTYSTGIYAAPLAAVVSDFNEDNYLDIVVVNGDANNIVIFLGYGNGSFQNQSTYSTGHLSSPYWAAVADLNNDTHTDIVTANLNTNNIAIFFGDGKGNFPMIKKYSTGDGSSPSYVAIKDLNNDTILDIVVTNFASNAIVILFGFGDGTFLLGTPYSTGIGSVPNALDFGDFNKDSQLDIAVANDQTQNIVILFADDTRPLGGVEKYSTGSGSQPQSIVIGDLNNDGRSDLAVANYGTNNIGIFISYASGSFYSMVPYSTGINSKPYSIAIGDFNNDHQLDLVVTNSESNNLVIFLGYGNGSFYIKGIYSTGEHSCPYTVIIADLNNDNKSDIIVTNSGTNNIFFLYGFGNGNFGNEEIYPLSYGYQPYSIAADDLDDNGWIDLVIACYNSDNVEVILKLCF